MDLFSIMPIIVISVFGLVIIVFIFTIIFMFSSRARAKMIGKKVKTMNYVIDENEDALKNISTKGADIASQGVEITARAIKKGFSEEKNTDFKFCKHCGKTIDSDSIFCNYCGKEQ